MIVQTLTNLDRKQGTTKDEFEQLKGDFPKKRNEKELIQIENFKPMKTEYSKD